MKHISILGSTGSIGTQALEIVRGHRNELIVEAISGNNNIELLLQQISEFSPKLVCVYKEENAKRLSELVSADPCIKDKPEIVSGMEGLIKVAVYPGSDIVLTAIVGMIGIRPTVEAIHAGKDIALANKETLVCAGHIIMSEAARCAVNIYPVDSEHSAIFQSLQGNPRRSLDKIILTASGGPFRGRKREELEKVTLADALKHPNWSMGQKVTIDSSTLANKGLEVIEARWLFNVRPEKIQVVIQPQSIIHSAVQYDDGAIIAQLGTPDMKLPIQYAFFYPERPFLAGDRVDFFKLGSITFEKPDTETFKALALAYEAIETGGSMPCVFNAANERAVADFVAGKISYLGIADFIEKTIRSHKMVKDPGLDEIIRIGEDIMAG
ncbi:MAG: 1-deoxy-D-xylulose-5-phosphate reductoisomerase [Lachnospiraceae bacterium]|nr:1-deoxy-D-xylulose-5-phosphate reductoisomerase [Lachnospiraceae bacterium]